MNDPLDYQTLFNIAFALACGGGGLIVRAMLTAIRDMQRAEKELTKRVSEVEVLVAGQYVTKGELSKGFERIERSLTRIEDKLDGKADK